MLQFQGINGKDRISFILHYGLKIFIYKEKNNGNNPAEG